jgi:hypothetical protein
VGHMSLSALSPGNGGCWIELWFKGVYRHCALIVVVAGLNCGSHECTAFCNANGGCWFELLVTWVYRHCKLLVVVVVLNYCSDELTGIVHCYWWLLD